jgi:hypothetical protein
VGQTIGFRRLSGAVFGERRQTTKSDGLSYLVSGHAQVCAYAHGFSRYAAVLIWSFQENGPGMPGPYGRVDAHGSRNIEEKES